MNQPYWRTEKLYYQHQDYFDSLCEAIQQSKHSIELETYIFDCDEIGNRVLSHLKEASERGVQVRVVVDGFGSVFEISKIFSFLSKGSVQLRVFHPLFLSHWIRFTWLRLDRFFMGLSNWNRRLHRKICLIDREILFLGSFNITMNLNRETGARVTGDDVAEMLKVFDALWDYLRGLKWRHFRPNFQDISLLRLNSSRKIRKLIRKDLCRRISSAQKRVWITNAYFVPPPVVLKAIVFARLAGVEVEIIVPKNPEPRFMKLLTETYYRGLLGIGVKIYEYQNEFLHVKSLLIDDWAVVGSSNLNYRSFFQDLEVDVVLTHQESLLSLENQFGSDRGRSRQIGAEVLGRRPWMDRFFAWFLRRLRGSL